MNSPADPTVTISLTVKDTAALSIYKEAFGAEDLFRMPSPEGGLFNAEFMVGNKKINLSDEYKESHAFAKPKGVTSACLFTILVEACDTANKRAVASGATTLSSPADQLWGVRTAVLRDPFGYRWCLSQGTEELTPAEIERRARRLFES